MSDEEKEVETVQEKRPRGRPRKIQEEVEEPQVQAVGAAVTKEDDVFRRAVESTKHISEEDANSILLGYEKQGNLYDIVRNTNELMLPEQLQKMHDQNRYRFRWLDSTESDSFFVQQHRQLFKWTLVTRMFPGGKLPGSLFDQNGAITRGRLVLAYMPYTLWLKWREVKHQIANTKFGDRHSKGKDFYDPVARDENVDITSRSTDSKFTGLVHEVTDERHPDVIYEEAGEYV